MLQGCLNALGTFWQCDRHVTLFTERYRHRFVPGSFHYGWSTVREEWAEPRIPLQPM